MLEEKLRQRAHRLADDASTKVYGEAGALAMKILSFDLDALADEARQVEILALRARPSWFSRISAAIRAFRWAYIGAA